MKNPCYKWKISSSFKMIEDDTGHMIFLTQLLEIFNLYLESHEYIKRKTCNSYKCKIFLVIKQFYLINLKCLLTSSTRGSK